MVKSLSNEQLFSQGASNYVNKMSDNFILQSQGPIEQNGLNGHAFQLELNENARKKGLDGFIMGRLFRNENRVYTVTYIGVDDKNVGNFINSFRLIKYK